MIPFVVAGDPLGFVWITQLFYVNIDCTWIGNPLVFGISRIKVRRQVDIYSIFLRQMIEAYSMY